MPTRCKQCASIPKVIWYHVPTFLRHIQDVGTCFCFNSEALSPSLACSYFMTTSQQKLMPTCCKQYAGIPNVTWYHFPTFIRHIQGIGILILMDMHTLVLWYFRTFYWELEGSRRFIYIVDSSTTIPYSQFIYGLDSTFDSSTGQYSQFIYKKTILSIHLLTILPIHLL